MGQIRSFINTFIQSWTSDRPSRHAAALAYYGMFAFAPILYVVLRVAGLFINEVLLAQEFYARVEQLLGADMARFIQSMVFDASLQQTGGSLISTLISLGALLYAATGLFNQLRLSLNTIWHVGEAAKTGIVGFVIGRLLAFLLVIGLGVVLVIAVFASVAIAIFRELLGIHASFQFANVLIPIAMIYVTVAVIYKVLPDVSIPWRYIWIGAGVTTALICIGSIAVLIYLRLGSVGSAFEAAGSLAVLLISIYYIAQIFLAGALFTRLLSGGAAGD
jgi:membrane protein